MKRYTWLVVAMAAVLCLGRIASADEKTKTITGKASCGGCSGVVDKCSVMLTDKDGMRWILTGDQEVLKEAFKERHTGKSMTAKLSGDPVAKKDKDGKEYKEVKVTDVKIAEG